MVGHTVFEFGIAHVVLGVIDLVEDHLLGKRRAYSYVQIKYITYIP